MTATYTPESEATDVRRRPSGPRAASPDYQARQSNGASGTRDGDLRLSRALGWFSIGLGLAEVLAPERVARLIGMPEHRNDLALLRGYGVREITSGLGILANPDSAGWVWTRVVGDALDLTTLGMSMNERGAERGKLLAAAGAVAGVAALDVMTARRLQGEGGNGTAARFQSGAGAPSGIQVRKAITIAKPADEIYSFWRDFRNLPRFMQHLEAVEVLDDRRSRWTARAPAGSTVEWDAEIVEDTPNERIAWRSVGKADVDNQGSVTFRDAPGDRGTEVLVELRYDPPGGKLGALVAKLFGEEPSQQVGADLRALKQVLETGEVVRSDASIHRGMHPAQPSGEPVRT